jgi:hypothetical protein
VGWSRVGLRVLSNVPFVKSIDGKADRSCGEGREMNCEDRTFANDFKTCADISVFSHRQEEFM